ncbi:MAG: Secreted glycosyl hydrolase [Sphaerisporangium sp.]|nr:Secreted glycosyl hydrolase [Sphaerisporangium sp.]
MAAKHTVPILLAAALAGGVATGTVAMAAAETGLPALTSAARWQPTAPDTQPPTAPTNLRLTELSPWLIRLNWDPSKDGRDYPPHPRVVAYDIYASTSPFRLIASVPGDVLTYTDRRSPCVKVSYYVKARDAAGNVSPPSNIVTRHRNNNKCDKEDDTQVTNLSDSDHKADETENSAHNTDNDEQIIKADKLLHLEEADDGGGSGGHWSDSGAHGRHEGGGPGHAGSEAYASAGHQPGGEKAGGEKAAGQQAGRQLPFTGAPVATVAGVGGALLVAGLVGILISVRRRRSTSAK